MDARKSKRPATPDPAQPAKEWPPCDPATVAPTVTRAGSTYPDLYNHAPTRNVSREEALARGWRYYFDGGSCRAGHVAPRPISNASACVDCSRIKRGLPPIGAAARHQRFNAPGAGRPPANAPAAPAALAAATVREPDARDKRFLAALAEHRDPEKACATVGATRPGIDARLSYDPAFRDAVRDLCERMLIVWTLPPTPTSFAWTDEKRAQFIQVWIDTGDIATAREAVGCTPSAYFAELESNTDFQAAVDRAKPLAAAALEDRAHALALAGNSKLLEKLLAAKKPEEYGDRLRVDVHSNNLRSLTDEQLTNRLAALAGNNLPAIAAQLGFRLVKTETLDAVAVECAESDEAPDARPAAGTGAAPAPRRDTARADGDGAKSASGDPGIRPDIAKLI